MAMDFIGLSVGMGYTDETVIGGGALKGENCVISNIEEVADGVNVTFQWTLDNGTVQTETVLLPKGTQGEAGVAGKSAYEIWLEAGNTGTEEDFLISLVGEKGADGKSAYQYAQDGGYIGTETEFTTNIARSGVISKELEVERARIDNLTTLQDGSTTGDAELIDARIDKDGNTHVNVGEHIRTVSSQISSDISNYNNKYKKSVLNVDNLIIGKYVFNDSVLDSSVWRCTDFIEAKYGDRVVVGASHGINLPAFQTYDANRNFISMYYSEHKESGSVADKIILDKNAKYIRCNVNPEEITPLSQNYIYIEKNAYMLDNITTTIDGINTTIDGINTTIDGINTTIDGINTIIDSSNFTNMIDYGTTINNSIIDYLNGEIISNKYTNGYSVSDFIPINYGDLIVLGYVRGISLCGGALYDENKKHIATIWGTDDWSIPTTDFNKEYRFTVLNEKVKYIRYNIVASIFLPKSDNYIYIQHNHIYRNEESCQYIFYVGSNRGGNNGFTTLKECTEFIMKHDIYNSIVYVDSETFDLVSEYGENYLDSIVQSDNKEIGLHVGNNTHFIFSEGSKVVFNYDGTNLDCVDFFSPFNITGSVTLENVVIEATNARYCVHEDLPTSTDYIPEHSTVKYINCVMEHKGATVTSSRHNAYECIGGGTNRNTLSIIKGGKYKSAWSLASVSYHNYYGDYPSKVVIENAYMDKGLLLDDFGTSDVEVQVTGCYMPSGIVGNHTHFTITEWNNSFSQ